MKITSIFYSSHFKRAFKKLPKNLKAEIIERENIFRDDCFDFRLRTHKLGGKFKDFWSFSLTNSYRVMFLLENEGEVMFVDVDDHDIYH